MHRGMAVLCLGCLTAPTPHASCRQATPMRCSLVDVDVLCRCTGVRKNALMVLTHLILNDMMKVKGHIARMAMCLQVHLPYLCLVVLCKYSFPSKNSTVSKQRTSLQRPSINHAAAHVHCQAGQRQTPAVYTVLVQWLHSRVLWHVQDSDSRIASLAHLFFEELSHKVNKVRR